MSSIIFGTRTSDPASSNTSPILEPQKRSSTIQLDSEQQSHFEKKLLTHHIFESKDGMIKFPFTLLTFFKMLVADLELEGIVIDCLPMIGSQMVDVLIKQERPHKDQDFLILIREGKNLSHIRQVFLDVLFKISVAQTKFLPDGKICCYMPNGQAISVRNKSDLFGTGALDSLGMHGNIMPITLPFQNFKIDITFAWDLDASCLLSANSFQGDILPFLKGEGPLNHVIAADGYDADESLKLLKMRFFYVETKQVLKLRDGLRGYIHAITSGNFPTNYASEQTFLSRWLEEYPTESKQSLYLTIISKHFQKHYNKNHFITAAYLINLRTFFFSKEFAGKDFWLSKLDTFAQDYVGAPRALETALFWNNPCGLLQARLDCAKQSEPTRFRIDIPDASILVEAPWDETVKALVSENPPPIPAQFSSLYAKEIMLARLLTLPVIQDDLVGKLLTLLVKKKRNDFIFELARNFAELSPAQIRQFEKLWLLVAAKNTPRFSFGQSPIAFLTQASLAGFTDQVKMVFPLSSLPDELTEAEGKMLLSLATTKRAMQFLAQQALPLLADHLITCSPTQELFDRIKALSLPVLNWPASWIDFIAQKPANFPSFSECATFAPLRLEVARKLISNPTVKTTVEDFLVGVEPSLLAPSQELLAKIQHLPPQSWPDSWIHFIEQNAHLYELFMATNTFSPEFKLKVTIQLLKRENLFATVWPIACRYGSLPEETKEIIVAFKKAGSKEISLLGEGLLNLFEVNRDLAIQISAYFFKAVPFSTFEKAVEFMPLCWRLLQLCSGARLRRAPLSLLAQYNCFKVLMKTEGEILPMLDQLLSDASLTTNQRTEVVVDLIGFSQFLHPKLQLAHRAAFAQNFLLLVIHLFQDSTLIEKRAAILQRLDSLTRSAIPLPSLAQAAEQPFEECLEPLARDLKHAPEMVKYYVQWLIKVQTTTPAAAAVLSRFVETLEKEQVFPGDALRLFERYNSLSESLIVQVLASLDNPQVALAFLKRQNPLYPFTASFEKYLLEIKDWALACAIAREISRLGGKELTSKVLSSRKIQVTQDHFPLLEQLIEAGVDGGLIWKAASTSLSDKTIKFRMHFGKICSKRGAAVESGRYFAEQLSKKMPFEVRVELIQSDLIPLTLLWQPLQVEWIKEGKIQQAFFYRLSHSTEYATNFQILAELSKVLTTKEASARMTELFFEQIAAIKEWEPENFWRAVQPLLSAPFLPNSAWYRVFIISRNAFVAHHATITMTTFFSDLVEQLKAKFTKSPEFDRFLTEVIQICELIDSTTIPLETIWNSIRHLPKEKQFLDAFIARLKANTDYVQNFKLLFRVILDAFPHGHLGQNHIELFNHYFQKMTDFPLNDLWVTVEPLLSLRVKREQRFFPVIPLTEWEKVFAHTAKKMDLQSEKSKNILLLRVLTPILINSPIWSESTFLFLIQGLELSTLEYSEGARIIWEDLIALAPKVLKNPSIHTEAGMLLERVHRTLSKNTELNLPPNMSAFLAWTQTPLLTKNDFMESLEMLLANRPPDFARQWFTKWIQLTIIDWDLEDFLILLNLLERIFKLGDYSLGIASQFILFFHFGRYLSTNPNLESPTHYLPSVEAFHKAAQNLYNTAAPLAYDEDFKNIPFPFTTQLNEFFMMPGNKPENPEVNYIICKIPDINPRAYLLTRLVSVHATILNLGKAESKKNIFLAPQFSYWAKELFAQYKKLHFFLYYESATFTSTLRELFGVLATGNSSEISFLMNELNLLIKTNVIFKELTRDLKRGLFSTFIRDIIAYTTLASDCNSYPVYRAVFDFIKEAIQTPEWEVELYNGNVLFAQIQFLIIFNKNNDIQRALESAKNLIPLVSEHIHNSKYSNDEQPLHKGATDAQSMFNKHLSTLVGVIVKEKEMERAIEKGLKSPEHAKFAANVLVVTKEYKAKLEKNEKKLKRLTSAALTATVKQGPSVPRI